MESDPVSTSSVFMLSIACWVALQCRMITLFHNGIKVMFIYRKPSITVTTTQKWTSQKRWRIYNDTESLNFSSLHPRSYLEMFKFGVWQHSILKCYRLIHFIVWGSHDRIVFNIFPKRTEEWLSLAIEGGDHLFEGRRQILYIKFSWRKWRGRCFVAFNFSQQSTENVDMWIRGTGMLEVQLYMVSVATCIHGMSHEIIYSIFRLSTELFMDKFHKFLDSPVEGKSWFQICYLNFSRYFSWPCNLKCVLRAHFSTLKFPPEA